MPKLLFFDIDGTLFDDQRRLPASVLPALRQARERGCLLFLNTGRTLCNMDPRLDALPLDGRVLGCGTRVVFHGETLKALEFSPADTDRLRREVLSARVPLVWECDTALYFDPAGEPHPAIADFRSFAENAGIARDIRPDDPDFRAVKMFAFGSRDLIQSLLKRFDAIGLPFQAIDRRENSWELVPAGCSKASGIDLLCERLGVPLSDCYAFGDSENDLPMLTHVSHSIAMGNAPESVRRRCAHVAPRPEQDGIARALTDLGLISPIPDHILVRGARVHNLKNIDADIPLNRIVAIAGVSGSGKSSLALGVLYAEGSRRYLESLSTYTRRRMTQAARADVDEVLYVPASLALHQRPGVPGIRSTFGTGTELLNSLRLMFSRLASHRCPNGHYAPPGFQVALMQEIECPVCGERFYGPGAEELAFNSGGACKCCGGTGTVRTVDRSTLIPDDRLTIDEGAVAPWNSLMWSLMTDVCREMGVRTDIPFRDLTDREKEIVYDGPMEKKHIFYRPKKATTATAGEMDFTYYSATATVLNALNKVKDEKGMKRVEKFLKEDICPECHGTRLSDEARAPRLCSISLADACTMTLKDSIEWVKRVPDSLPEEMRAMAKNICEAYLEVAARLMDLGLSYLTLDRASSTLSTGERQRMQLARAVRNRTTGVLYVLDEPSIGLHPANIVGLTGVMHDLVRDGNSVLLVDHDTQILKEADWLIELGPEAGAKGGAVIAQGTVTDIQNSKSSVIGAYLRRDPKVSTDNVQSRPFERGEIFMRTGQIHTVKPLEIHIPQTGLTVITGVSGSGKTTMILESLVPALDSLCNGKPLPPHVKEIRAEGISHIKLIDAAPIGINVRSTVATYAGVHDELRKIYGRTRAAREKGYKAGDFSYNTGSLRCPVCDGTGQISLDVQFLPDVDIPCPECRGSRYGSDAKRIRFRNKAGQEASIPGLMAMDVNTALGFCSDMATVKPRLEVLRDLGLGYLTLGEETPGLSGGEAQRLKLASEMGRQQSDSVFVFDEPTIGLHPKDTETLLSVFRTLIDHGATVIVIEHDLDVIRSADYIIDMGPGGGEDGGTVVACGTPEEIRACKSSITGRFI